MKTSGYFNVAIFATILAIFVCGCSSRLLTTKPITPATKFPQALERAIKDKRYFIMQSGLNFYTVTHVDIEKTKQLFTVTLDKVDSMRLSYFKSPLLRSNREAAELSRHEIHLYMTDSTTYTMDEPHTIPMSKLGRVELLN